MLFCEYCVSSETRLLLSFSVQKVDHMKAKDVAWPFKVVGIQEKKTIYLSASSQDDQQVSKSPRKKIPAGSEA